MTAPIDLNAFVFHLGDEWSEAHATGLGVVFLTKERIEQILVLQDKVFAMQWVEAQCINTSFEADDVFVFDDKYWPYKKCLNLKSQYINEAEDALRGDIANMVHLLPLRNGKDLQRVLTINMENNKLTSEYNNESPMVSQQLVFSNRDKWLYWEGVCDVNGRDSSFVRSPPFMLEDFEKALKRGRRKERSTT